MTTENIFHIKVPSVVYVCKEEDNFAIFIHADTQCCQQCSLQLCETSNQCPICRATIEDAYRSLPSRIDPCFVLILF